MLESVAPEEAYQALLKLLGSSELEKADRFITLRAKIHRFFAWRGEKDADQLADEVLSRLAKKVAEGAVTEAKHLPAYSFGIARRVYSESLRWQTRRSFNVSTSEVVQRSERSGIELEGTVSGLSEGLLQKVDDCLATLNPKEKNLLVTYYEGEGGERINERKKLAEDLGIPLNALRLRVFRARRRLEDCLQKQKNRNK